jgi:cephalosporin-C deacetylase-like acetyl esterase
MVKIEEWTEKEIKDACSFSSLINRLYNEKYSDSDKGLFSFSKSIQDPKDFKDWQERFRVALKHSLRIDDLLHQRNEKNVEIVKGDPNLEWNEPNYRVEHFYIKSWMDTLIPVFLCIPNILPNDKKMPAMICTHGHVMQKLNLIGKKRNFLYKGAWAKDFAEMGCITIAMDQLGWGERGTRLWDFRSKKTSYGWNYDHNEKKYALNLLLFDRILNGIRYFEVIKQVDFLLNHKNVDPTKIGIAGLSLGGSSAIYSAALDPRISLVVADGYLNTFKASILDKSHCPDNYIPGMLNNCEMYDIARLIAPRPACYITGKKDPIFPIEAAKYAFSKVKDAYKILNAEDKCKLEIHSGGHQWKSKPALSFVKKMFFDNIS